MFSCEDDKSEISLHKVMEDIRSGKGGRWDREAEDSEKVVHVLLAKSEIQEVSYSHKNYATRIISCFLESGVYEGSSGYDCG